MSKSPPAPKLRRDVWDTMSLCERAMRKAEKTIVAQIKHDELRHGGVLRLVAALDLVRKAKVLCADHEDMV